MGGACKDKYNNSIPSPIAHGSLVRTIWADEILSEYSAYATDVNDGWESPGIYTFSDFKLLKTLEKRAYGGGQMAQTLVPHGTKGLMIVNHHWIVRKDNYDELWYKLLYKEKIVWASDKDIVLIKNSIT